MENEAFLSKSQRVSGTIFRKVSGTQKTIHATFVGVYAAYAGVTVGGELNVIPMHASHSRVWAETWVTSHTVG